MLSWLFVYLINANFFHLRILVLKVLKGATELMCSYTKKMDYFYSVRKMKVYVSQNKQ